MRRGSIALCLALAGCTTLPWQEPAGVPAALLPDRPAVRRDEPREAERLGAKLSVDEAVRFALANNRDIASADRAVLMARDRTTEQWTRVLPTIKGELKTTTRSNDFGNDIGFGPQVFGDRAVQTAKVSAMVPIYTFGRADHTLVAAHLREEMAAVGVVKARQDLEYAVRRAFYRVLEAERIRGVVDQSIQVVERQLAVAKDFLSQGLVARNDVLASEVQLAERRQSRITAENNLLLARAALNRALGRDLDAPLDLVDVLEAAPEAVSYPTAVRTAVEHRPDLELLRKEIEVAKADYRSTRAGTMPVIYAFADANWSSDDTLVNSSWISGGVALEWPFFDGLATWAALRRKDREMLDKVAAHDNRVEDAILEVKVAWLAVREAAERVPVARKAVEQGEENLRIVRDQYAEGLVSTADVLTEEDRLSRTRSGYFQSLYAWHEAHARLTNVVGGAP